MTLAPASTSEPPAQPLPRDALFVFALLLLFFGYFQPKYGASDWVASSRASLVYAVVDRGVLHIDDYHENTGDKAFYDGHYYIVGSIGPSLLAVPAYAAFTTLVCSPAPSRRLLPCPPDAGPAVHPPRYGRWALSWITFFAISLPSAALGAFLYWLIVRFRGARRYAFALALCWGLATAAFPYSWAFYQHQPAAIGLTVGFYLLWRVVCQNAAPWRLWAAGFMMGLAIISEYPVALPAAIALAWAAAASRSPQVVGRVVLGAVPLVALQAVYDQAIFGTPIPVGYRYHVFHHVLHSGGFMGMGVPSWRALYGITFSPARGLFFMSPLMLLMIPGFYVLWRERRHSRGLVLSLAAMVGSFFLYTSAYGFWTGGYSVGPRFLIPMLPLAMLPVAAAIDIGWRRPWGRLAIVTMALLSLLNVWAQSIAGQYYAPIANHTVLHSNPVVEHALPLLAAGDIATNYAQLAGLTRWWSLAPLFIMAMALVLIRERMRAAGAHPKRSRSLLQAAPGG